MNKIVVVDSEKLVKPQKVEVYIVPLRGKEKWEEIKKEIGVKDLVFPHDKDYAI